MTEDAGQNYLILMEKTSIYLFIQITNSGVWGGGGQPPPSAWLLQTLSAPLISRMQRLVLHEKHMH